MPRAVRRSIWTVAALAAVLAGCSGDEDGEPPSDWREHVSERRGFRVSVPPGWHRAERSLSPSLTDPVEILTVATFPLPGERGICRSLAAIPPDQALVSVQERGRAARRDPTFPPRPASFEPDPKLPGRSTWPYCLRGDVRAPIPMLDYWFGFRDAGRAFHVLVGIGRKTPAEVRRDAFRILDTLRFDPEVRPGRRSAG